MEVVDEKHGRYGRLHIMPHFDRGVRMAFFPNDQAQQYVLWIFNEAGAEQVASPSCSTFFESANSITVREDLAEVKIHEPGRRSVVVKVPAKDLREAFALALDAAKFFDQDELDQDAEWSS